MAGPDIFRRGRRYCQPLAHPPLPGGYRARTRMRLPCPPRDFQSCADHRALICVGRAVSHAVGRRAFTSALFLNLRRLPRSPTSCRSFSSIPDPGCTAAAPRFRLPAKGGTGSGDFCPRHRHRFLPAPHGVFTSRAVFATRLSSASERSGHFTRDTAVVFVFPVSAARRARALLSRRSSSVFRVCENRALIRQYFLNECYLLCLKNPAI